MADHSDEPHDHTLTFTDNDGNAYSLTHDCPCDYADLAAAFVATGAGSVNGLCVDGKPLPFEAAFTMLGTLGLAEWLGTSYMTPDNLFKVLAAMGAGGANIEEEVTA